VRKRPSALRVAALLAGGSLAVHELRYLIGYSGHAEQAMSGQGHGYLSVLAPAVGVLLALALAGFWAALSRARRTGADELEPVGLRVSWLGSSTAIALVYTAQESLEGAPIVADGGWAAFLLALVVGLLIALLLRGAAVALIRAAGRPRRPRRPPRSVLRPGAPLLRPLDPVARLLAARGPPLAS
jgi:hypothetical protein